MQASPSKSCERDFMRPPATLHCLLLSVSSSCCCCCCGVLANATACVVFIIEIIAESRHNYILILIAVVVVVSLSCCSCCYYCCLHSQRCSCLFLFCPSSSLSSTSSWSSGVAAGPEIVCSSLGAVGLYSIVFVPSTRGS